MPGTLTPSQSFTHELNGVKGWFDMGAVDKRVQKDSSESGTIYPGSTVYLDSTSGQVKLGTTNGAMGLFAWQGQDDFDVNGDVGNIISNYMNCLVACGAYELETTEYSGSGFVPNAPLTAGTDGKVVVTTINHASHNIIGVVSDAGPIQNEHGINVVRFWPVYCPQRA